MEKNKLAGTQTALVTPFDSTGKIDYQATEKLVEHQISGGVSALVTVGTTGESPTLSHSEHIEYIRNVAQLTSQRVPIVAGTGSNATSEATQLVKEADNAGADAHLQVAPYYNKPNQEGLYQHFSAIAAATTNPIILYSIPGRCGIQIDVDTMARLYEAHPHILGVKEAGGSSDRISEIRQKLGPDYLILSGDDSNTLPFMSCGGNGVISVASNLVPQAVSAMVNAAQNNDYATATRMHLELFPLFRSLFLEPNPAPCKHAMHHWGYLSTPDVRSPLCHLNKENRAKLEECLKTLEQYRNSNS